MRFFLFLFLVGASPAFAQQSPCQSKCNQQASECLKSCAGDPKDAQRPEQAEKLMVCLRQCEKQNGACKQRCEGK